MSQNADLFTPNKSVEDWKKEDDGKQKITEGNNQYLQSDTPKDHNGQPGSKNEAAGQKQHDSVKGAVAPSLSKDGSKAQLTDRKLPEQQGLEFLVDKMIQDVWAQYDKDKSGNLNRNEARKFLKKALTDLHEGEKFTESKFSEIYAEIDRNKSGSISQKEMRVFIRQLIEK